MSEQEQHLDGKGRITGHSSSQAEASERSAHKGPPSKPSEAVSVGRGEARERAELSPQGEAEQSGLCLDDVSRETPPEKTDAAEELTPEQRMLYDIMDRGSQKPPAGEEPETTAPPQGEPEGKPQDAPPPPPRKNSPTSFYSYLVVLFGAAFLMLLLAYFVQQRNSAAVQDDLRLATASREELMTQIKELEEKRDWLQNAYDLQRERNDQVDEQNKSWQAAYDRSQADLLQMTAWYDNAYTLDCLERFIRGRDYLMAGTIVADSDMRLNQDASVYTSADAWQYLTPANEKRYLELKGELLRKGGVMTQAQEGDGSGYAPGAPIIDPSAFGQEEQRTAQFLWSIIRYYALDPEWAAYTLAAHYDGLTQNSGLFKPSTMELLEEMKEDLIAQELLTEEDGVLTANVFSFAGQGDCMEPLESDPAN